MDEEREEFEPLKQEDHYHVSVPFEYVVQLLSDDDAIMEETTMEVDFDWDDSELGYRATYYCADADKIDPAQGNGTFEEFKDLIETDAANLLEEEEGIPSRALINGTGRQQY